MVLSWAFVVLQQDEDVEKKKEGGPGGQVWLQLVHLVMAGLVHGPSG
jgi:hypothetical protein